jgi:hypothetical protein
MSRKSFEVNWRWDQDGRTGQVCLSAICQKAMPTISRAEIRANQGKDR